MMQIYTRQVQQVQTLLATVVSLAQKDFDRGRRQDAGQRIAGFRPTFANNEKNQIVLMQRLPDQMAGIQSQVAFGKDPRPSMISVYEAVNALTRR